MRGGKLVPRGDSFAHSIAGFMNVLKRERVACGAGDHGSAMVWIDDAGLYRCTFYRFYAAMSSEAHKSKAAVRRWLKEWLPKMATAPLPDGEPIVDGEGHT